VALNGMDRPLGELIVGLRNLTGMTQEELAHASGLSVRSISDLERGRVSRPRRRSLELLTAALDLDRTQAKELIAIARGIPARRSGGGADSTSDVPEPVPRQPQVTPRQLPGLMGGFVGRSAELKTLSRWLDNAVYADRTVTVLMIAGATGVGKTTLATQWGHEIAERFPDGQLWLDLRGFDPAATPLSPAEAIRALLDAFNIPPGQIPLTLDARADLYRRLMADRRILVVLDNARDASQVRPLIPGSPGCLLIVTSRRSLFGLASTEGARLLNLDVLTAGEARQLLARRLGQERLAAEPEAADELIRLCAGLPLALLIAVTHAHVSSNLRLADLAVQLRHALTA
jgi:transcriptional regulator with XRE-family HTH domain